MVVEKELRVLHLDLPALEPFLYDAPPNILKYVAGQFSKVRNAVIAGDVLGHLAHSDFL